MSPADVDGYPEYTATDSEIEVLVEDLSTEDEYERHPCRFRLLISFGLQRLKIHISAPKMNEIVLISTFQE